MPVKTQAPTAVEVRFEPDGRLCVLGFTWMGSGLRATGTGRNWMDATGRHVLVLTGEGRIFELLLRRSDLSWHVVAVTRGETLV